MKRARRRAREYALQGLYQWQLTGNAVAAIEEHLSEAAGFAGADADLFAALLRGTIAERESLMADILPFLDRPPASLSPVERGILLMAAFELKSRRETPYRVVLSEAIELAKVYGGVEGYKYVNGVLDKLAGALRPDEHQPALARRRASAGKT